MSRRALSEFEVVKLMIDCKSAHSRDRGMLLEELNGGGKVVGAKAHVAVHVADVLSAAVLKPELRARAAGSAGHNPASGNASARCSQIARLSQTTVSP